MPSEVINFNREKPISVLEIYIKGEITMWLFFSYLLALAASGATNFEEVSANAEDKDGTYAQVPSKGSVLQQFAGYDHELSRIDFEPVSNSLQTGNLRPGTTQNIALTAPQGPILIAGFCEEGCTNLEIVLRDASGTIVSESVFGDTPVVDWRRRPEQVSVAVRMRECTKRSCSYGIQLYRPRPQTLEDRDAYDDFWGF